MHKTLEEVQRIVESMDENITNGQQPNPPEQEPEETYHVYPVDGGVFITKEELPEDIQVIDSTPLKQGAKRFDYLTLCIVLVCCIPMFASIAFQLYGIFNPSIANITIIPKSQQVSLIATAQLGRLLNPITIRESQTVSTTGKGHQSAKQASGAITFYNGQLNSVSIPAGTIFTASTGAQIITEQQADIPAGNPPSYGQTTITAHAVTTGRQGNIPSYAINQACCAISVLAVNLSPFQGGQNERDFSTVRKQDINKLSTPLEKSVAQSMQGALQGQLTPNEQLYILPCSPTVTSDHQTGQEATTVKVSVSETCSAAAYNRGELETKATDLLSHQAAIKPGTNYSLLGAVKVTLTQATRTNTTHPLVFLTFHASGTWLYGLSQKAQEQVKHLIAGKTKQEALNLLAALPGIAQASINWTDDTRLPKNTGYIHIRIFVM